MLILMKQYGRLILCCMAALLVLSVLFYAPAEGNAGFFQTFFGEAAKDMQRVDVRSYGDIAAVLESAARSKPEITYAYTKVLAGTKANLGAMFTAVDANGNPADVKITGIEDAYGASVYQSAINDTAAFLFPSAGVYTVYVKAVDAEKKVTCGKYKIPVAGI